MSILAKEYLFNFFISKNFFLFDLIFFISNYHVVISKILQTVIISLIFLLYISKNTAWLHLSLRQLEPMAKDPLLLQKTHQFSQYV